MRRYGSAPEPGRVGRSPGKHFEPRQPSCVLPWRATARAAILPAARAFWGAAMSCFLTDEQQAAKLHLIADLSDGELRGWWRSVFIAKNRPEFPGERDALLRRAKGLGLKVKG